MKPEAYRLLSERQRTYWWHRARRTLALDLLRRHGLKPGARCIDVGCGPGGNLHLLDSMHPSEVVGVDLSPIALELAARNAAAATLIRADLNDRLPFADASFDVATIFNVLYHQWVKSEAAVLAEVYRIVRPGGLLLLTEPAFDSLRRELDESVMTRRRYHLNDIKSLLSAAGFEPLYGSYFTSFGFPLLLATKVLRRRLNSENYQTSLDMRQLPAVINGAFLGAAMLENFALTHGMRMPFGTTVIWIARRHS